MKKYYLLLSLSLLAGGSILAQDFEDDIYYDGKKAEKKEKQYRAKQEDSYEAMRSIDWRPSLEDEFDVDEYNRYGDYYVSSIDTIGNNIADSEDFVYTKQIQKYYNPTILVDNSETLADILSNSYGNVNVVYTYGYPSFNIGFDPFFIDRYYWNIYTNYYGWSYAWANPWYWGGNPIWNMAYGYWGMGLHPRPHDCGGHHGHIAATMHTRPVSGVQPGWTNAGFGNSVRTGRATAHAGRTLTNRQNGNVDGRGTFNGTYRGRTDRTSVTASGSGALNTRRPIYTNTPNLSQSSRPAASTSTGTYRGHTPSTTSSSSAYTPRSSSSYSSSRSSAPSTSSYSSSSRGGSSSYSGGHSGGSAGRSSGGGRGGRR